jgi:SAM-dependent methyltransferase
LSSAEVGAIDFSTAPYDLIYCGSLLPHMDAPRWDEFLKLFESILAPGGILVFTTIGAFVAEGPMRDGTIKYGLRERDREAMLRSYEETGFGFAGWERSQFLEGLHLPSSYGISLSSPSWVMKRIQRLKLDPILYVSGSWGERWGDFRPPIAMREQEVIACIRRVD